MSGPHKHENKHGLSNQQLAFCDDVRMNPGVSAAELYMRHYKVKNLRVAQAAAPRMLAKPKVKAYLEKKRELIEKKIDMTQEEWYRAQLDVIDIGLARRTVTFIDEIMTKEGDKMRIELEKNGLNLPAVNKALEQVARLKGWLKDGGGNNGVTINSDKTILFVPAKME